MVNKTFILKMNSEEIRKKITDAGIYVCPCARFADAMVVTKRTDIDYLLFSGTELTSEMNNIWRFIRQTIKDHEGKESSKTT